MMDKVFDHKKYEAKIYKRWEESGVFTPRIPSGQAPKKKPFTIILPLPNANDPIHIGHALFTVEDILVRYHRMLGEPTLWLPGSDHAGIETQYVFEKHLKKQGKSRFDFDRETLYKMIWDFVEKNREINIAQMKRLGFSLDWTRYHYSLEPKIVSMVLETFKRLYKDGLVYRGERIVNYCAYCGTAFSDLEVDYTERKDPLYYIKYGPFIIATTRTEDFAGNTGVAYHPGDKRYEKYLGKEVEIQGVNGPFKVKVVADEAIEQGFGTGIEKVTPGHDALDFELSQKYRLPVKTVIDMNGKMTELAGRFAGMKINEARKAVYEAMLEKGLIDHVDENYVHRVAVCYRCGTTIEPMVMPQWFIKTKSLAKPAIEAVKKGKTKIVPKKRFEKMYFDWMENIHDWNVSRQIVWGPRIPAWYRVNGSEQRIWVSFIDKGGQLWQGPIKQHFDKGTTFKEIKDGLQRIIVPIDDGANNPAVYVGDNPPAEGDWIQETDTFDTWFLSGQWPVNTLKCQPGDLEYFYPTSVLDTLWDILFFWVGRMMMFGLYLTGKVPFGVAHMHARVVDAKGQKMSKSKGNVVDPIEMVEKYGADALRMTLVFGVAPASDIAVSEEKVKGMRNFANKIWNMGRYVEAVFEGIDPHSIPFSFPERPNKSEKMFIASVGKLSKEVTQAIEKYRFGAASEAIYEFSWHEFADKFIEKNKENARAKNVQTLQVLRHSYFRILKLLHPFMPFVTEAIWGELRDLRKDPDEELISARWPSNSSAEKST